MKAITQIIDVIEAQGPISALEIAEIVGRQAKGVHRIITRYLAEGDAEESRPIYIACYERVSRKGRSSAKWALGDCVDAEEPEDDGKWIARSGLEDRFIEGYRPALRALAGNVFGPLIAQLEMSR